MINAVSSPMDLSMLRSEQVYKNVLGNTLENTAQSQVEPKKSFEQTLRSTMLNQEEVKEKERLLGKEKTDHFKEVSEELESIFVNMMFKSMRKTLQPENNPLYGGQSEEIFTDMMYEKVSQSTANSHDFGIAKPIYQSLIQRA